MHFSVRTVPTQHTPEPLYCDPTGDSDVFLSTTCPPEGTCSSRQCIPILLPCYRSGLLTQRTQLDTSSDENSVDSVIHASGPMGEIVHLHLNLHLQQ